MDSKSIIQISVAALVAVMMFVSVLVPVVSSAQEEVTTTTYNNVGISYAFENSDKVTIHYDHLNNTLTVGDVVIAPEVFGQAYVVYGDTIILRLIESAGAYIPNMFFLKSDGSTHHASSSAEDWTMVLEDGSITYTRAETTINASYSWLVIPSKDGDLIDIIHSSTSKVYVNNIDEVVYSVYDGAHNVWASRNMADSYISEGYTFEVSADLSDVKGTVKSFTPSDFTGTFTNTTTEATFSATFSSFLVPKTVVYSEETNALSNLLGVIPILAIVGLIVSVIGFAIVRRYDL